MHLRVEKRCKLACSDPGMLLYSRHRPSCCQFSSPSWPCLINCQYSLLLSLFSSITPLIGLVLLTGLSFFLPVAERHLLPERVHCQIQSRPSSATPFSLDCPKTFQQRRPRVALSPRLTFFCSMSRRRSLYVSGVHPFA